MRDKFISSPVGLKQEKPGLREGERTGWVVDNNPPDFNPFLHAVLALNSSQIDASSLMTFTLVEALGSS